MALTTAERAWYALMNVGLGGGYFAKLPTKKALADAGLATMTGAERVWYRLMCVSFGAGYFLKIPAAKALSESALHPALAEPVSTPPASSTSSRLAPTLAIVATVIAVAATAAAIWSFTADHAEPPGDPVAVAPPNWHFDGIYRIDADIPNGIVRTRDGDLISRASLGVPAGDDASYAARKTTCDDTGGCETISIRFDNEAQKPVLNASGEKDRGSYRWNGTRWVADNDGGPNRGIITAIPCADDEAVSDRWESWTEMIPLMDGTFSGTFHQHVMTDACGIGGDDWMTPITVTRVGDAPAGIFD